MVVGEASIHNIMGGMESTGGVRLHNHKRKLKQRFDIIKKLGQGTYGKVQLGINKETGQEVAIKTIKKCKIETEADLIRIRREIQIMSSVQHPNIIHIYEVFENREKMVLVMEYAAGGELYDYLSERKVLTEHEARRIFRQIATAVFYCHKHKICHRDLKLENILLDQAGNAKIADFGLSNVFDEQRLLNTFCGSPLYASPEIVKGTPYHGPEVDCWSLGVLLYTLVYGAMPFDGSNFKRLVKQISQSAYFEPKKPSPASPLIKDMLTVCPGKRADVERICTHWWVNEGYEQNCLDIAEELAAQTPVRLDLLLSLVPPSASAEKLVVGDQQAAGDVANNVSSETLVPTRCHSVGSLMELDQNNSDRRIRELLEEEPRSAAAGDAKRKLETTPSMDETAAAGVKRKERSRRKDRTDEREPRAYRSASRHHSAPIPNSITEEAMEVDPVVTVPTSNTIDMSKVESSAACLELIKECNERSPSKERSKTPVMTRGQDESSVEKIKKEKERVEEDLQDERAKSLTENTATTTPTTTTTVEKLANDAPKFEAASKADSRENEPYASEETINLEATQREFKKLKEKALSLDSELSTEPRDVPARTYERRRSKIFETAEKFNQMASNVESEKPKKIFIPGVNVGGAKRVFERKASLSSIATPPPTKPSASKIILDVPTDRNEKPCDKPKQVRETRNEEEKKRDEAKKRAVDIITGAIGKPPVQRRVNGSPPISPPSHETKKLPLKIPVGANDFRTATVSCSTPVETSFSFDSKSVEAHKQSAVSDEDENYDDDSQPEEPKRSSKMEITLKSATLPRSRKTSKAEICLSSAKSVEPVTFRSEVEAKIDAFQPQKLRTQRSEIAFPVAAAVPQTNRSASLEPDTRWKNAPPKERIIPIQMEGENQESQHSSTPPPPPPAKPPMPQRLVSQRSGSLSRQSTADSDTDSALGSTVGPEPIRKSPREYIIPIAVEGGGYVTPRSGSVEPESKTSTPSTANAPRSRFTRPRRMSSFLSDASEDESPFSTLHRDSEDLLQRHMHRLRSSRPSRQPPEHADSLSSGEDDDDDGFELLTAENLFSTLLSRVRSLTQRLNVDDNRTTGFPSSRLFGRLGSNSSQAFWGLNKPLSRRLTESQFRHSLSREGDVFSKKDTVNSSNPGTPDSPGSHGNSSRETVFDIGSNTLPRDKIDEKDVKAEPSYVRKERQQESVEQSFTPSLARRLSKTFIEQSRQQPLYRRSISRETTGNYLEGSEIGDRSESSVSDQTEYKDRSSDRTIRRTNSLLEPTSRDERRLLDDEDEEDDEEEEESNGHESSSSSAFPRHPRTATKKPRREKFRSYRTDKIQEETILPQDTFPSWKIDTENPVTDNGSTSECTSASVCNSNTNLLDGTSSVSAKSYETSPTESSSNVVDYRSVYGKSDLSRNFENRLLAAENLIKESKLKNLGPSKFDPNLTTSYRDTDKCEKQSLISMSDAAKRRSCIPSLRLRSGSLSREPSSSEDRRKSLANAQDILVTRPAASEKSILSKLLKAASGSRESNGSRDKEKPQKSKQHRISRFLRPDFFDTPREESQYAKEKEAQKAAENERRKSRFIRKKTENKASDSDVEHREKESKNEIRSPPVEETRNSFLHSLEKKLEKLRSNEEPPTTTKPATQTNGESLREHSAPPTAESEPVETGTAKKTISADDLTGKKKKKAEQGSRNRVSSVLGLFKTTDAKQPERAQNAILSRLKRSPPKRTKSIDATTVNSSEDAPSTSRIPTKLESKSTKKLGESNAKRSPPKEKPPILKERRASSEKETKAAVDANGGKPPEEPSSEGSIEKRVDEESVDKKAPKVKKSPTKKLTKPKETSENSDANTAKKKKIVTRTVKKVAKKSSDSSESKTEEKEKPTNPKRTSPERVANNAKAKEKVEEVEQQKTKPAIVGRKTSPRKETTTVETKNGQESQRANRSNLKLDLSKIPQHSFRNSTATKKDSPRSDSLESPKTTDKLMDCLSKVTHRANIAGNKIVIEKPLRAKDVAELKREVTECARMIESRAATPAAPSTPAVDIVKNRKESPIDYASEPFSPVDEAESFDSWSISSAELNHARPDLHSPTSPTQSLLARSDNSESVIDRIRRRSFYSRFNDRRRPSLTAPPPGLGLPTGTGTLPRKYSFTGHRDRSKYGTGTGYGLALVPKSRRVDRSYSLLADDTVLGRNRYSSLDRPRYNDAIASSPYISDPTEHLAPLSSSYDPLRRYLRSPSFDLSASRTRYHSADFGMDAALDGHPTTGLGSSTLPRKYPSNLSESKTAEYYEELLAPTSSEYLPIRRPSPVSIDYLSNRCENGYYNGTSEPRSSKRNLYKENATNADYVDRDDYRSTEPRRSRSNSDATVESVQPTTCTTDRS